MNQLLWVSCYVILLVFTGSLLHLALSLLAIVWKKSDSITPRRTRILRSILGLLATGVCFGLFYDSMFVRFSCIEVKSNQIALIYFWPKPSRVIALNDLVHVAVERDRRRRGELVLVSKHGANRSIVCPTTVNLNQARDAIQVLLQRTVSEK